MRAEIARFFADLRRVIGASPFEAAARLRTHAGVVAALERAEIESLPPWPETQRVVLGFTAWAGIDGRPVLNALGILFHEAEQRRRVAVQVAALRPAIAASAVRLRQAKIAIAEGAKRLPREALNQARERPVRTFYAVSLPLGMLVLALNTGLVHQALAHIPRPIVRAAVAVKDSLAVHFAPVREGLRWIEVENPRSRRSDKLSSPGFSPRQ